MKQLPARPVWLAVGALAILPAVATSGRWAGDLEAPGPLAVPTSPAAALTASEAESSPVSHVLDRALAPLRAGDRPSSWRSAAAAFDVSIDGDPVPFDILALQLLPGQEVVVEAGSEGEAVHLRHGAGRVRPGNAPGRWRWTAPSEPGAVALRLIRDDGIAVHVNAFVAHPADWVKNGVLEGYRIGRYAKKPLRGLDAYLPPRGFVQVSPADEDILVSPHMTLGQFLCKQPGDPRFVHLSTPLLVKLETVLEAVNEAGYPASTFHVMSGFRTPAYNLGIGNKTMYSRHLWGDAADVWVDENGDGEMDDWNGDGRSDIRDARILSGIVTRLESERPEMAQPGGVGLYSRNHAHGPFVHVDARGYPARW